MACSGAVRVGDDAAAPSVLAVLERDQVQVLRVDLRNQKRDQRIFAVCGRVGAEVHACFGKVRFDLFRNIGRERGKDDLGLAQG